ncbi:unnamed protein product [Boreogadus saida]
MGSREFYILVAALACGFYTSRPVRGRTTVHIGADESIMDRFLPGWDCTLRNYHRRSLPEPWMDTCWGG